MQNFFLAYFSKMDKDIENGIKFALSKISESEKLPERKFSF